MALFDPSRHAAIVEGYRSGLPMTRLGSQFGLSRQRIFQILKRNGIETGHRRVKKSPPRAHRPTLRETFEALAVSAERVPFVTCLLWPGFTNSNGYGMLKHAGRNHYAHRLSWEFSNGSAIPEGLCVLHRCDFPLCFDPAHLFLGTSKDNATDRDAKGRGAWQQPGFTPPPVVRRTPAEACIRGHVFSPENTYVGKGGHRSCRACWKIRARARKQRLTQGAARP